ARGDLAARGDRSVRRVLGLRGDRAGRHRALPVRGRRAVLARRGDPRVPAADAHRADAAGRPARARPRAQPRRPADRRRARGRAGEDRVTFSIVARDPATGDLGVAVQSHWFAVGAIVPWAEPGVGAIATQSFVETAYGRRGLERLRAGGAAAEVLAALV